MDISDIFYFFCSGEGKGESEAPGGGDFLLKIPGGGGVSQAGGAGGSEDPGGCSRGIGGAAKFFFFGAEIPTKFLRFPRLAAQICYIYSRNVNTR